MLNKLQNFQRELTELSKDVSAEGGKTINKSSIRNRATTLSHTWLEQIAPELMNYRSVDKIKVAQRNQAFQHLIKLSAPANLKTSYEKQISIIRKGFRDAFIIPVQLAPKATPQNAILDFVFGGLDETESDYLKEALDCAKSGYLRASVVLGWCAAINRIHRKIEEIGFVKMNMASETMANETVGRFKKFNQRQSVSSISELRMVFDNVILWVVEGMQLIDSNQHARLSGCFEMRNHSGHPGEAPITLYNLASFFSDLNEIIFKNPKFALQSQPQTAAPKTIGAQ